VRAGSNFSLFFNASVGAMKEGKGSNWPNGTPADGQRLLDLLGRLPPTDLAFSTVSSGNTDENGWRDHVYWAQALQAKIMTTGHAPVGAALQYYSGFMNHLKLKLLLAAAAILVVGAAGGYWFAQQRVQPETSDR
jgi:hypothetical protein